MSGEVPAIQPGQDKFRPWSEPLFRWAGSKRKLVPILARYIPKKFDRYFEPFVGSACLFFAIRPQKAVLGDINGELLEAYEVIRLHPRIVARAAHKLSTTTKKYYKVRAADVETLTPFERATRFVYLNRNCFNGIYRTNKAGQFNVPMGIRTGRLQDESSFYRCSVALRSALFRKGDFENCLKDIKKGDFAYLDPPYAVPGKRWSGEYGYDSFATSDIERLISELTRLDRKGAKFLLSYADCPELRSSISSKWNCDTLSVRRHIAGFAEHRTYAQEVLVYNYSLNDQ